MGGESGQRGGRVWVKKREEALEIGRDGRRKGGKDGRRKKDREEVKDVRDERERDRVEGGIKNR